MKFKSTVLFIFILCFAIKGIAQTDSIAPKKRTVDLYSEIFKNSLQGKEFINFSFKLLNDSLFKLSDQQGKFIVLNFWFIGCAPCMGEIPDLNKLSQSFKDSNFVFLSFAKNSKEQVNKFNNGKYSKPIEEIKYPVSPDCSDIAKKYQITGYPTTVFIDKKGIIRLVFEGVSSESLKQYVNFYGEKGLSKEWKRILKETGDQNGPGTVETFSKIISDLLSE